MEIQSNHSHDHRPIGTVLGELLTGVQKLIRGEAHLVQAELKSTAKQSVRHTGLLVMFGVIALLGLLPFVAFLVIGLGELLNYNYWLSSLIVSLVFMGVGIALAAYYAKLLKEQDFSFPHTRRSLHDETENVRDKTQEIVETIQRRAS